MRTNIIGFSGRIESGKDTIAKMVQFATQNNDTVKTEMFLKTIHRYNVESEYWYIKKFAAKLKQVASMITGIQEHKFEDQGFKKTYLEKWGMTVREFLQRLGTDAMRDGLHENVWVNALWADYDSEVYSAAEEYGWLITDVRFKNEADSIKERGGVVVRLTRNYDAEASHPSETELDNYDFDYVIDNKNQSLAETYEKVKKMLSKI